MTEAPSKIGQKGSVTARGTRTMARILSAAALAMKAEIKFREGNANEASRCRWPQARQDEEFQQGTLRAFIAAATVSGYLE
jgi:uncharacterized membrane protein YebE (DUF533 family)